MAGFRLMAHCRQYYGLGDIEDLDRHHYSFFSPESEPVVFSYRSLGTTAKPLMSRRPGNDGEQAEFAVPALPRCARREVWAQ